MLKAILFDLDGTLLPMEQEKFTFAYFEALSKTLVPYGYDPERLIGGVWQGTKAMVKNNGEQTNEQIFWKNFSELFENDVYSDIDKFNEFYENEFGSLKNICGFCEQANQTVTALKDKFCLVLASNPIFPMAAQRKRVLWAGVNPKEFSLITSYENSRSCKPNPLYYREIAENIGVKPCECLMVGNDATEDMVAKDIGMNVFLLTNCLINKERKDISQYPRGGFIQLSDYIEEVNRI